MALTGFYYCAIHQRRVTLVRLFWDALGEIEVKIGRMRRQYGLKFVRGISFAAMVEVVHRTERNHDPEYPASLSTR